MAALEGSDTLPDKAPDDFLQLAKNFGLWSAVLAVVLMILAWRSAAILDVLRQWHKDCGERRLDEKRWNHEKHEKDKRLLADLRLTQARLHMGVDNAPTPTEQGDGHDE